MRNQKQEEVLMAELPQQSGGVVGKEASPCLPTTDSV